MVNRLQSSKIFSGYANNKTKKKKVFMASETKCALPAPTLKSRAAVCRCELQKCQYFNRSIRYVTREKFDVLAKMASVKPSGGSTKGPTDDEGDLEVREIDEVIGKGVFATRDIAAGKVWLETSPIRWYANDLDMSDYAPRTLDPQHVTMGLDAYREVIGESTPQVTDLKRSRQNVITISDGIRRLYVSTIRIRKDEQISKHYGLAYWYNWHLAMWWRYLSTLYAGTPDYSLSSNAYRKRKPYYDAKETPPKRVSAAEHNEEMRILVMTPRIFECIQSWSEIEHVHRKTIEDGGHVFADYRLGVANILQHSTEKLAAATAASASASASAATVTTLDKTSQVPDTQPDSTDLTSIPSTINTQAPTLTTF
jgi:hypothetical protein